MSSSQDNNQHSNNERRSDEHFDELDAARRFPSEDSWLDLPAPPTKESGATDASSFVDRVMNAHQEDQQLDAQLDELQEALPNELLHAHEAPTPSSTFVDETVKLVMSDRRQRWQEMLSRYVSPKPSASFVSRTLQALGNTGTTATDNGQLAKPGKHRALPAPTVQAHSNWPVFALLSAAAAAMLWLIVTDSTHQPLEARLAKQASPAFAYANSASPMPAILVRVAHDEEPFALFDKPADGLWLSASNKNASNKNASDSRTGNGESR